MNALIKQERLFWGKLLCFCTVNFYYFKHRILCLKERRPANFLVYFAFASPSDRGLVKFIHIAAVSLTPNFTVQSLCCFYHWKKKEKWREFKMLWTTETHQECQRVQHLVCQGNWRETQQWFTTSLFLFTGEKLSRNSVSGSGVQFLAQPLRKTRVVNSPCPPCSLACLSSLFSWGQPVLFRAGLSQPR